MKIIPLYLSLCAFFLLGGCTNLEQYQEPVNELVSNWQSVTQRAGDFAGKLMIGQKNTGGMIMKMRVPENIDLGDEGRQQAETFITEARSHFEKFDSFNDEMAEFMDAWEEQSDELAELQEGLEAGELNGDIPSQISHLQERLSSAQQKLAGWETELEATTAGVKSAYTSFMGLLPKQEIAQ
jgi:hypothetical protein